MCISPKAPEETEVSVHVSDSEDEDLDNDEYLGEQGERANQTPLLFMYGGSQNSLDAAMFQKEDSCNL